MAAFFIIEDHNFLLVEVDHDLQTLRTAPGSVTCSTECFVASLADILHGFGRGLQELTWVEVRLVLVQELTNSTGRGHTQVGIDVHFTYTVPDTFGNLFNRKWKAFL